MENRLNSFDKDLLNRRPLAINLTNILGTANDINVIAINSAWGTGKSTFVSMWQNMLETEIEYKDKYETLYFNAWENDYLKDPFMALISEIDRQLKKEASNVKKGLNYVRECGKKLVKPATKAAVKIVTRGVLDLEGVNLGKYNEDEITKLIGDIGELSIQEITKEKDSRSKFINYLEDYTKKENINIIFFIDELDRCRPSFAIELLEVIKHMFNVNNIKFVISVDKEQLAYSISTLYGQGMDSEGYLRRFFDLEYKIPIINKRNYIEYKNTLFISNYKNTNYLKVFLRELFARDSYSFRDIDKAYGHINLLMPIIEEFNIEKDYKEFYIIVFSYIFAQMINIKLKHHTTYERIITLNYDYSHLGEMLDFNTFENLHFNLESFSEESLKQLLLGTIEKYLMAIKLTKNWTEYVRLSPEEEKEYVIGIRNEEGEFYYDTKVELFRFVGKKNLNFIGILELLDNFVIN